MGFKKGRAARAAAAAADSHPRDTAADMEVLREGSCIEYVAANGSHYRVDVATMEQVNVRTNNRRKVGRQLLDAAQAAAAAAQASAGDGAERAWAACPYAWPLWPPRVLRLPAASRWASSATCART